MSLFFLKGLSWVLNLPPRRAILFLGDVLGWTAFTCLRFRRKIVIDNLTLAFGDSLTPSERLAVARRNYQHYGRTFFEILLSINWTAEDFKRNVIVEGLEFVRSVVEAGSGGFLLTGHLGNWEWAITAATAHGLPIDVVVKKMRTKIGEDFMQWYRRKTGAGILHETGTAKDILRSLSRGRLVGFILDQFMGPPIGLPVKLFGKTAGTAVAVALLTEKREVPILPTSCYRDPSGKIHVVFEAPIVVPELSEEKNERLFQKTQFYNDVLEARIRRHPEQWLWLHRRWKPYRGEPRWLPSKPVRALLLIGLFFGPFARAQPSTGITLPSDPVLPVPSYSAPSEESSLPHPSPAPRTRKERASEKKRKSGVSGASSVAKPANQQDNVRVFSSEKIPFSLGERLEIDLTWTALPAGRAVMEVKEGPVFQTRPTFELNGSVLSSRLLDAFYHIDNSVQSYVDRAGLIPYKLLVHMAETFQKKETRVAFDHVHHRAFYWAKRISSKWGNQDIDRADDISPEALDMFSAVYYARALEYSLNQKQVYPVYENGQNFQVELTPVANELVKTKAGVFQCWKIRANVAVNNLLKPTGETYLWLSDDSKKYVVKFQSKLKYGALMGLLVSIKERNSG